MPKLHPKEDYLEKLKGRYAAARKQIREEILEAQGPSREINIAEAYELSKMLLGTYVTLDWGHRQDITTIRVAINKYTRDATRKRPLNIVMQAEPGSGKSHLVKCLAKKMTNSAAVDYNMANLQNIEDLIQPLDAIRNHKVIDRLPILFLDEFDSDQKFYALLLPLLWDGELHIGHRDLKLGKLVVILAGSGGNLEDNMKTAKGMQLIEGPAGSKLRDLLSRINGGEISIPPLDQSSGDRDRRVDKVCLTISLLEQRFGETFQTVPLALLQFVGLTRFRYGVRSIAHLVDLLSPSKGVDGLEQRSNTEISPKQLTLPLSSIVALKNSSLAYHLIAEDGPASIVQKWKDLSESETMVRVRAEEEEEDAPPY